MSDAPVTVAMRYAQALWPHDVALGSEAVAYTWGKALSGYTVDELLTVFDAEARTHPKMPSLNVVLDDLRDVRRKAMVPDGLLHPPAFARSTGKGDRLIRDKWRRELLAWNRDHAGRVDSDVRELIDDEVAVVGPHETAALDWIAKHPGADWGRAAMALVESFVEGMK